MTNLHVSPSHCPSEVSSGGGGGGGGGGGEFLLKDKLEIVKFYMESLFLFHFSHSVHRNNQAKTKLAGSV